ncbi:MAG: hypothetical protein ACKOW8_01540 [Flavobacteriales bacterium]
MSALKPLFYTALISMALASCSSAQKTKSNTKEIAVTGVLKIDTTFDRTVVKPNIQILQSSISGDTLWLDVEYSGGCATHSFELKSKGLWMKSMPPKLNLYLIHQDGGDACREVIREKLSFIVNTAQYGSQHKVRFIVNENSNNLLEYNY